MARILTYEAIFPRARKKRYRRKPYFFRTNSPSYHLLEKTYNKKGHGKYAGALVRRVK